MNFTRRQFLGASTAAGFGALNAGCDNGNATPDAGADGGRDASIDASIDATADVTPDASPLDGGVVQARVVVIGTGFGGAVAALRLSMAGIPVVMLERGRRWTLNTENDTFARLLVPDRRSTWLSDHTVLPFGPVFNIPRYVGALERVVGEGINLYAGAGVGGGSLVYGGFAVTPRELAFTHVFPSAITYAEMRDTYYPRARQMLRATPIPADVLAYAGYNSERVFLAQAARAGVETTAVDLTVDWDVIRGEIAGTAPLSALAGEVIYGNNNGSKISLDRTYLQAAEATGMVTINPLHQVRDISAKPGGGYLVFVDRIDETGNVLETKTYACEYLFLAAGTYGTTNLLVKAKAKGLLPHLDDHVGQSFGNNGNAMFMRWGLHDAMGPTATGPSQCSFGGQAMVDFGNTISPALVEHAQFPTGIECNCLLQLGMCLDPGTGTFRYDAATDKSVVVWPATANERPRMAMQNLADRLNAANGGTLSGMQIGITVEGILGGFTYHPLGGMVLGEASDYYGRVNNYPHLYAIDGLMLPRSAGGVNPALTITALAERAIERILRDDFH